MNEEKIAKKLNVWWNKIIPECKNNKYCDLCCDCFNDLCNSLGCEFDGLTVVIKK